jgi:hypothetical protein
MFLSIRFHCRGHDNFLILIFYLWKEKRGRHMSHLFPLFKVKIISQLFYTGGYLEKNKKSMSVQKTWRTFRFFFFFLNIIFIEKSGHGVIGLWNSTDIKRKTKFQFFYFKYWIPVVKNFIWNSPCSWWSKPIDLERLFFTVDFMKMFFFFSVQRFH